MISIGWLYMAVLTVSHSAAEIAPVSRFLCPPAVVTAVLLKRAPVSARVGPVPLFWVNRAATRR